MKKLFLLATAWVFPAKVAKVSAVTNQVSQSINPYKVEPINFVYNLLFCDNLKLPEQALNKPYPYPFDLLLSDKVDLLKLQEAAASSETDARTGLLVYTKLRALAVNVPHKKLLGVVMEVGVPGGLDVLAVYADGTARYINHTENVLVWETTKDDTANRIKNLIFSEASKALSKLHLTKESRKTPPKSGYGRITLLASDGSYTIEYDTAHLFDSPRTSPTVNALTVMLQFLVEQKEKQDVDG